MKTPISYYGGKQTMLKHILPLIPDHTVYTESFCGGAAVLFAKEPIASNGQYQPAETTEENRKNGLYVTIKKMAFKHCLQTV